MMTMLGKTPVRDSLTGHQLPHKVGRDSSQGEFRAKLITAEMSQKMLRAMWALEQARRQERGQELSFKCNWPISLLQCDKMQNLKTW